MNWSRPADFHTQLQRLWQRGELLRATVSDDAIDWPLRLSLKSPSAADLRDRFEAVRTWVQDITTQPRLRIAWRESIHRVQGRQRLPEAIWVDSLDDALALLGKASEARRFQALWQQTAGTQPDVLPWLQRHPLQALALAGQWSRLLAVIAWIQAHPRPGVYLRQVDAPGIDSKFIEAHRSTLAQWLDLSLPAEAIDQDARGVAQFARRYGFRDKPVRIRLRLLDARLPNLPGCTGLSDITLDADSFAALDLPIEHAFITENEVNFLAFPPIGHAIVIFGAGYGWEALAQARWLNQCRMHYWGDIDTHGFAILDSLRSRFPHAASLLMDRPTLLAHQAQWGEEPPAARHDQALLHLTPDEGRLYDDLRQDRLQARLRLEQERIGYGWLRARLATMVGQARTS
ncbi:Wadjet anti-phage system protein JetD domain-containing protein [Castellaniella sp.]|uniref:Wadjet anti-phage system protein JetD domain-containing protein n=1 Tax=Castellaniella sp. TaxID=1955812 RepID=UPI00355D79F0